MTLKMGLFGHISKHLYKLLAVSTLLTVCACGSIGSGGQDSSSSSVDASCKYVDLSTLPQRITLNVPYVKQEYNYCGPASLSMVMAYYGSPVSQDVLGSDIVGSEGSTSGDLLYKFEQYGFAGAVINCEIGGLLELVSEGKPIIVRILNDVGSNGHFVVITGYDIASGLLYLNDPDKPYRKSETLDRFKSLWNITTLGDGNNSKNLAIIGTPTTKIAQLN